MQGADGNRRAGGINGHAAAVGVFDADHVVHVGIARQQFLADARDRVLDHALHTLHGGGDGKDVARADGAVGVAVALERVAL
ncbi:hypothetical protein D3C71_1720410 [compost metagenome]